MPDSATPPAPTPPPTPETLNLLGTPLAALVRRAPLTVPPHTPIQAAAQAMREAGASSVMLVEAGRLTGLVTDRDLRNRVLAAGLPSTRPVAEIATPEPFTLPARASALDALMLMARHNIHHVPVLDDAGQVAGMVSASDVSEQQGSSAVLLTQHIFRAGSAPELATLSARVRPMQQALVQAGGSAYAIGHIVTAITDALTVRLLQLAERQLGAAPVPYVWVAAGSQARMEQTAKSDQDNCLMLDNAYSEEAHGEYFSALARFVNDGLNACGYVYCPGDMMASNAQWRQPMRRWRAYFGQWVDVPQPKALMLSSVFFDLRAVHGQAELLDDLRDDVLERTRGNSLFLGHMVANALKNRPPLGLFGRIALIKSGSNARTLDLKVSGITPIVDLARICALAAGLPAVNTADRLAQASEAGSLSPGMAHDLRDALEFLSRLRIAHQARQSSADQTPDNFLRLEELSDFDRGHMKQAFTLVQQMQSVLKQRY
ncbi:MAG: putative nucleotidyltransferase substrate binding domain-containing protein [Comamonadaceae bacterium]|nr:putative nucleotidyltransferase substrate binding domain-containing protein [Comamonadaceae bacterium]